jgi:hypothetical protein
VGDLETTAHFGGEVDIEEEEDSATGLRGGDDDGDGNNDGPGDKFDMDVIEE